MIEQEIVFALGFLTAGLLALACLPAVWRRAIRLTTRRLTQLVPLSMDEITAERDGLRAGFAIEQRRLEQRAETVEAHRTDLMVRLGRKDATIALLEDAAAVAGTKIARLTTELHDTTQELFEVRGEAGTAAVALHDLGGLSERRLWDVLAAEERSALLQSTIDENRATIASLETRLIGLDSRLSDLDRALGNSRAELARTVQATLRANAERDAALARGETLRGERDTLADEVVGLKGLVDESQHRAAIEAQSAAAHKATIDELRLHQAGLDAQMAMQSEAARAAADRLRELMAEKAAVPARSASSVVPVSSEDGDLSVLRDALRQVSDAVLRLTEGQAEPRDDAAGQRPTLPVAAELSLPQ